MIVFKTPKKSLYLWANFNRNFDTKNFQKAQSGHNGITNDEYLGQKLVRNNNVSIV